MSPPRKTHEHYEEHNLNNKDGGSDAAPVDDNDTEDQAVSSKMDKRPPTGRIARIRRLNDQLRTTGTGGTIVITDGIAALSTADVAAIVKALMVFDSFDPANDPYSEHDCAGFEVKDHRILFKIDYYDRSLRLHSPDPGDPKVTARVLTVMLANEY